MYHKLCQLPRVTVANNAFTEVLYKEKAQLERFMVFFAFLQHALVSEVCFLTGTPVGSTKCC